MIVARYNIDHKNLWNAFVDSSVNGCFLHRREFMEYHQERFIDYSLMIWKDDKLIACFPAHQEGSVLKSHKGLTYGSLLYSDPEDFVEAINSLHQYMKDVNFHQVEIKLSPAYYNSYYEAQLHSLFSNDYKITSKALDLYINLNQPWIPSSKKTAGYRNGKFDLLKLVLNTDFETFWSQLLVPQLEERHHTKPVHTLEEIKLLHSRFPGKIVQYFVEFEAQLIGGITVFNFDKILKIQYAAANKKGFEMNAMEFLYQEIIRLARDSNQQYVDLGTVNHPDGSINEGLYQFKKQLGAQDGPVLQLVLNL